MARRRRSRFDEFSDKFDAFAKTVSEDTRLIRVAIHGEQKGTDFEPGLMQRMKDVERRVNRHWSIKYGVEATKHLVTGISTWIAIKVGGTPH